MSSTNRKNVKLFAAVIGGSAMVAFGAMSVAVAQQSESNLNATGATVGAVPAPAATSTAPVFAVQGEVAKPEMNGVPPEPSGEVPNRIP